MSEPREANTRSRLRVQGEAKARSARLRARAAADALMSFHPGDSKEAADGSRLAAADNGFFGGHTGAGRPPR
jgi:hypothetical protein